MAPPFYMLGLILKTSWLPVALIIEGAMGAEGTVAVWMNPIGDQSDQPFMFAALYLTL